MDILFIRDKVRHTDRADGKNPSESYRKKWAEMEADRGRERQRGVRLKANGKL